MLWYKVTSTRDQFI